MNDQKEYNEKVFWDMCMKVAPDLYLLSIVLNETHIRSILLVPIIKMLGNLDMGNGYGVVNVTMRDHIITMIKGEESIVVNERVTTDKS